jgi:hypothetical protein
MTTDQQNFYNMLSPQGQQEYSQLSSDDMNKAMKWYNNGKGKYTDPNAAVDAVYQKSMNNQ